MSAGHPHGTPTFEHARQYDALLHEPWFQLALERPYAVVISYDLPYVGGSAVFNWRLNPRSYTDPPPLWSIYVDQHAYPIIRDAGLLPGLVMHERVEGILLEHGWTYNEEPFAAHMIASVAEGRVNLARGILPDEADRIYRPLIKADQHERLVRVPPDLHMEPYLAPPVDGRLVARMRAAMAA